MNRPINDPNLTDLVAGHVLNDLSPEETDRLNQALAEEPKLYGDLASFREAFSLIPYDMPMVEPPAHLKAKIINAANQSIAEKRRANQSNVVPIGSRRNWKRWMPVISTGIAAVAVATIGMNQVQLSRQSQQTVALQQKLDETDAELKRLRRELQTNQGTIARLSEPNTQVYSLASVAQNPQANRPTARLLAKPGDVSVTLVTQGMPKLANDRIYRLWAVAKPSAAPMYCGQFRQDDSGTAQWIAPNAACTQNPSQLLITLDAPTDPITSAGPLVMKSFI